MASVFFGLFVGGNVGGNRIHADEGAPGNLRVRGRHSKIFLNGDGKLEGVDRVEGKPVRAEKKGVVTDL